MPREDRTRPPRIRAARMLSRPRRADAARHGGDSNRARPLPSNWQRSGSSSRTLEPLSVRTAACASGARRDLLVPGRVGPRSARRAEDHVPLLGNIRVKCLYLTGNRVVFDSELGKDEAREPAVLGRQTESSA